ncbi:MAG: tetratricopeptide repeat protein, partial [Planctomycetota bacterium]
PDNLLWQRELVLGRLHLGDNLAVQGEEAGALVTYRAALGLAFRVARSTSDPTADRDLSICHERVGKVLLRQGHAEEATESLKAALTIAQRLEELSDDVKLQHDTVRCLDHLGDALREGGRWDEARSSYLAARKKRLNLVTRETSVAVQRDVFVSFVDVGFVHELKDDLDGALTEYELALMVAQNLTQQYPENSALRRDVAVAHERVGEVRAQLGELEEAGAAHESALGIRLSLAALAPSDVRLAAEVAISQERLGEVFRRQDQLSAALQSHQAALTAREQLVREKPHDVHAQRDLMLSYQAVGNVLVASEELDLAFKARLDALAVAEQLARLEPEQAQWRHHAAECREGLEALQRTRDELAGSAIRRIEKRMAKRIKSFDLMAALALLRHLGYGPEDIIMRSNTSWASQSSVIHKVEFFLRPIRHVVLTMNIGLLSPFSPLPSYFRKIIDHAPIDEDSFTDFLHFFDHGVLQRYLESIYPEKDPALYANWPGTKHDYLQLMGLRSRDTLYLLFQSVFPELGITVERAPINRNLLADVAVIGVSSLGGRATLGGRTAVPVGGFKVMLYAEQDLTFTGQSWASEVQRRLEEDIFPLLHSVGLDLMVRLVIQTQRGWARLAAQDAVSQLGFDRIRSDVERPRDVMIFCGMVQRRSKPVRSVLPQARDPEHVEVPKMVDLRVLLGT